MRAPFQVDRRSDRTLRVFATNRRAIQVGPESAKLCAQVPNECPIAECVVRLSRLHLGEEANDDRLAILLVQHRGKMNRKLPAQP